MTRSLRHLALLSLALLVYGCAGIGKPADPRPVEEIVAKAESLIGLKAYAGAADLYAIAIDKSPQNGRYYLRRSELLEAIGRDKEARSCYREGLRRVTEPPADILELQQRLALLSAAHLDDIDTTEDLLDQMPVGSVPRLDIAGYLYYRAGQFELALKYLNQALGIADNADQKAIVLYHAALVYDALKDDKNSVTSLYHAINHASHLGMIRDISALWAKVNATEPLPRPAEKAQ